MGGHTEMIFFKAYVSNLLYYKIQFCDLTKLFYLVQRINN